MRRLSPALQPQAPPMPCARPAAWGCNVCPYRSSSFRCSRSSLRKLDGGLPCGAVTGVLHRCKTGTGDWGLGDWGTGGLGDWGTGDSRSKPVGARRLWHHWSAKASAERQRHREHRPAPRLADDVHRPSMGLDHCFDQAEAETEAALGAAGVTAKQAVEDSRQLVGGNPGAGVADAEN